MAGTTAFTGRQGVALGFAALGPAVGLLGVGLALLGTPGWGGWQGRGLVYLAAWILGGFLFAVAGNGALLLLNSWFWASAAVGYAFLWVAQVRETWSAIRQRPERPPPDGLFWTANVVAPGSFLLWRRQGKGAVLRMLLAAAALSPWLLEIEARDEGARAISGGLEWAIAVAWAVVYALLVIEPLFRRAPQRVQAKVG